jgi:2-polyprenyl-6-hydroxyphenyl methylase / 3-demethylubiquinone-9 3-methyltransferase
VATSRTKDMRGRAQRASTVDPAEIAEFERLASQWWDEAGPFRPLHALNPVRLGYLRDRLAGHFGRDPDDPQPLRGLAILDVGCGGGIVTEPLARLGARMTGIDAGPGNIEAARRHAGEAGLSIEYRQITAEELARSKAKFDAVVALEIVEHVADREVFFAALSDLLKPKGALVLSTLSRTAKSFLLGIVAAEYVLGLVPRGTHDWRRFVTPAELGAELDQVKLGLQDVTGIRYAPLARAWRLDSAARDVNYIAYAVKRGR